LSDLREDLSAKDNKMKQLRYENDRLFQECSSLKSHAISGAANPGYQMTTEVELELENFRKKVKRVTGELEVLETYFGSFVTLIKQSVP
jgi:hypothetical protein